MRISLRPASHEDKEFCRQVHHLAYHDVVVRQFGCWDEEMQHRYFDENWSALCAASQFNIVLVDGVPVGSICWIRSAAYIELLDIQLLPAYQGRGIGSMLIRQEQQSAQAHGVPMRLRVLKTSLASMLYQRLGFCPIGEDATHLIMTWRSDSRD